MDEIKERRELMERCTYRHPSGKIWLKRCEKYENCDDDCFYCGKDGPMQEALERLAIHLLDPATTGQAISEIEYYHGFSGRKAAIQAITEACELACEIMRKYEAEMDMNMTDGDIRKI